MTTIILANGPFGLLLATTLARHRDLAAGLVRVFHYATTARVIDTERWLAAALGFAHDGRWPDPVTLPAVDFSDAAAFRASLPQAAANHFGFDPTTVAHLVLPYHPTVSDVLTLAVFPRAKIHFYAEGLLLGFPDDLTLPADLARLEPANPYAKNQRPPIWTLGRLATPMRRFGEPRALPDSLWQGVLKGLAARPDFVARTKAIAQRAAGREITCLLLQPLADLPGWIDYADEMMLWAAVCGRELAAPNRFLLIKPHPSDHAGKVELLSRLLGDRSGDGVMIMPQDTLGALPLELYAAALPIRRVAGLCSSSLLLPAAPGIELQTYIGPPAAGPLAAQIRQVAAELGKAPLDLTTPLAGKE